MGRPITKTDCDELGAYIHRRNIICSRNLLERLVTAHAPAELDNLPPLEVKPTVEEPKPNLEPGWWHSMWFGDLVSSRPFNPPCLTIASVLDAVSNHYGIPKLEIISHRRTQRIVRPRQVCYYLAKHMTGKSLPEIGRRLGKRDHTSILSGINRIEELRAKDRKIDADVRTIASALGGSLG